MPLQPPRFEFYDPHSPIYTSPRFLPPAKIVKSKVSDAIISHGAYLEECTVENAIVGLRARLGKKTVIRVWPVSCNAATLWMPFHQWQPGWGLHTLLTTPVSDMHGRCIIACAVLVCCATWYLCLESRYGPNPAEFQWYALHCRMR